MVVEPSVRGRYFRYTSVPRISVQLGAAGALWPAAPETPQESEKSSESGKNWLMFPVYWRSPSDLTWGSDPSGFATMKLSPSPRVSLAASTTSAYQGRKEMSSETSIPTPRL